jgi:hypothetical protein
MLLVRDHKFWLDRLQWNMHLALWARVLKVHRCTGTGHLLKHQQALDKNTNRNGSGAKHDVNLERFIS